MIRFIGLFGLGALWTAIVMAIAIVWAGHAKAQSDTLGSALNYCRAAFVELNTTGSTAKTSDALSRLPAADQEAIALICTAYSAGQKDLLMLLQVSKAAKQI